MALRVKKTLLVMDGQLFQPNPNGLAGKSIHLKTPKSTQTYLMTFSLLYRYILDKDPQINSRELIVFIFKNLMMAKAFPTLLALTV